jgi:nitrogen fixation protein FixH
MSPMYSSSQSSPHHSAPTTGRPLTGGKVLAMLVIFFGIVFAVNFYMARVAYGTFSGQSTDSPYSEGIDYNRALAAARTQDALGWSVNIHIAAPVNGLSHVTLTQADRQNLHNDQLKAAVHFIHPSDRNHDQTITLSAQGNGVYAGDVNLARGHWGVELTLAQGTDIVFRSENQFETAGGDAR